MKVHVGDIVKNEVERSGKTKTQIAKDIPLSRTQFNNILSDSYMEIEYVTKIGKSIRYDFANKLPEVSRHVFQEDEAPYENYTMSQLKLELLDLQRKYIGLQETHIKILNELRDFERR